MMDHGEPNLRIDGITQDRDEEEYAEEEHVQGEHNDGYPIQPYSVVG